MVDAFSIHVHVALALRSLHFSWSVRSWPGRFASSPQERRLTGTAESTAGSSFSLYYILVGGRLRGAGGGWPARACEPCECNAGNIASRCHGSHQFKFPVCTEFLKLFGGRFMPCVFFVLSVTNLQFICRPHLHRSLTHLFPLLYQIFSDVQTPARIEQVDQLVHLFLRFCRL